MEYNMQRIPHRRGMESEKWGQMLKIDPGVGPDVVPFSVAVMELDNPPELIRGLKDHLDTMPFGYVFPTDEYYDAVCGWMRRKHGWEVRPEWVLPWPGVLDALYLFIKELSAPGEGVIVMPPVYYPFRGIVENTGRRIVENPLRNENGYYEVDFEDLERKAKDPENKLLILCSPHNPVGRLWTREELERVGRICIDNGVFILSDEIHADLGLLSGRGHVMFGSISEEFANNSIVCTAPTKTFNLAGLHVSNMIVPNDDIRKQVEEAHVKNGFEMLNVFAYRGCEIAYTECDAWLDQVLDLIGRNRDFVEEYLKEYLPAVNAIPLEATYLQWLDCRELGMSTQELETFMQKEASMFLDEGYIFGKEGEGFERINIACPTQVLQAGFDRLRDALSRKRRL